MYKLLPTELKFKPYPKHISLNINSLLLMDIPELEKFCDTYKKYYEVDNEICNYNNKVLENWKVLLFGNGKITKGDKKLIKKIGEKLGYVRGFPSDWKDWLGHQSMVSGIFKGKTPVQININLWNKYNDLYKFIMGFKQFIDETIKTRNDVRTEEEKLKIHLISKGRDLGLYIEDYDSLDTYMVAIEKTLKNIWIKENYPEGTEVKIDCCSECDLWFVGDRRCACGNRRIYLEVGGNSLKGFYAYGEPY